MEIKKQNLSPFFILLGLLCLGIGLIGWNAALVHREHGPFWIWDSITRILFYLPAATFLLITQFEWIRSRMSNWFHGTILGFAIFTSIYLSKDILVVSRLDHSLQDILLEPSYSFAQMMLHPIYPFLINTFGIFNYGPIGFLLGIWLGSIPLSLISGLFATANNKLILVAKILAVLYGIGSLLWLILLVFNSFGLHYLD